jgi:magnesium chelatase family protein
MLPYVRVVIAFAPHCEKCGYDIPTYITVNLAPADIRKEGSGFDLPIALGILGACGGLNKKERLDCIFVGELSLDGGIRGFGEPCPLPSKRGARS